MCKVSVVIPIYNAEAYLEETLHSVGSQTLHDIEIVCVDDGSTDHSADIIKKALVSDSRIRYLYQSNQGSGMARNKGIKAAAGEYIAFMDADDCYPNESVLETLYTAAEKNKALICGGSAKRTDTDKPWGEDRNFSAEGFIMFTDYQFDFMFWRFVFKRSFLVDNDIQFPPLRVYEDPLFLINALIKAEKFYAIKDTVYLYNGSHQSQSMSSEKVED
ncbi:MAG: glycosyltransferase, partial [Oscillospiraceae bacterium]|nr:glycosyltransferase [Oscillospiraceae bacterium]